MSEIRWLPILFAFLLVAYINRAGIRRFVRKRHIARSIAPLDENEERVAGRI